LQTPRWRRESRANPWGNFIESGPPRRINSSKKGHQIRALRANSLRIRTGNFLRPCREFKLAIREVSARIRESRSRPLFGAFKSPILPKDLERYREGKEGRRQMGSGVTNGPGMPKSIARARDAPIPGFLPRRGSSQQSRVKVILIRSPLSQPISNPSEHRRMLGRSTRRGHHAAARRRCRYAARAAADALFMRR
jgi:hypothetical protein